MVRDENPLPGNNSSLLMQMLGGQMGGSAGGGGFYTGMPQGYTDAMAIPLAAQRQTMGEDRDTVFAMRDALMQQQMDMASQMHPGGSTTSPMMADPISQLPPGSPGYNPPPGGGAGAMMGLGGGDPSGMGGMTGGMSGGLPGDSMGSGGADSLLSLLGGGGMGGQPSSQPGPDQDASMEPQDLMSLLMGVRGQQQQPGLPSVPPSTPQPGTTPFPTQKMF